MSDATFEDKIQQPKSKGRALLTAHPESHFGLLHPIPNSAQSNFVFPLLQESLTASSSSPSPAASFGSNNPAAFNQYHIHHQQYQHQQHYNQQQYHHHPQEQQQQQQHQQQYYGHADVAHQNPPRIVYNDLCNFPKTSNYGSMKKKKNKDRASARGTFDVEEEEETYVPGPRIGIYS